MPRHTNHKPNIPKMPASHAHMTPAEHEKAMPKPPAKKAAPKRRGK